ncbi:phage tail-collar fiber domain-containing protein [Aeromonas caviae]|uniref:phage tail-collar fiber domain-containing protein n=1 Tax=Aeromonas caviae TaxID=648 RepID=UPI003F74790D
MGYKTIHTAVGLELMTQAEATGTQIRLTHIAVGDGNGNPITPDKSMAQLVRERHRDAVNRVWQDPNIANKFSAEIIIPATVGGFTLREVGVFDSNGNLFVVGNLPDTYKPTDTDGAYSDTVIRVDFMVTNASVVQIMVDPNVVTATHQWVMNTITVSALLPGGTTHQVLRKKTNADGDTEWGDASDVNVFVDIVEETQTLAASQTVVDWVTVSNTGLAVYVAGNRLRSDEWTPDPSINTRITLADSYQAGTKIVGIQNEPAGTLPDPLAKGMNLADVPDKGLGRSNLSVYSKDETDQKAPPGLVAHFARNTAPSGWLKANGAPVSRNAYAALFAAIGTTFGAGDGFNTFNLPDLRGEFLRGWDDGRGVDGGRAFGALQSGTIQSHSHTASSGTAGNHVHTGMASSSGAHTHSASTGSAGEHSHSQTTTQYGEDGGGNPWGSGNPNKPEGSLTWSTGSDGSHAHSVSISSAGDHSHPVSVNNAGNHSHSVTVAASGSAETRPRNVALLACIKF